MGPAVRHGHEYRARTVIRTGFGHAAVHGMERPGTHEFLYDNGDRRYLKGIHDALNWLDNSYLPAGHAPNDSYTHAMFVEMGTNKPIYPHVSGTGIEDGKTWINYDPKNTMPGYGMWTRVDVDDLRAQFERISALTPEQAQEKYRRERTAVRPKRAVDPTDVEKIINSLDTRGAWVEDLTMRDYFNPWFGETTTFRGISIRTFIANMGTLTEHMKE